MTDGLSKRLPPHLTESFGRLQKTARWLIDTEQRRYRKNTGAPRYNSLLLKVGLKVLGVVFIISVASAAFLANVPNERLAGATDWQRFIFQFFDKLPFYLSPAALVMGACAYLNWRQDRELSIKLMDVVNSASFLKVRFEVVSLMKKADGITDIADVVGWFPIGTSFYSDVNHVDRFVDDHALPMMAYFMFQVSIYERSNLLHKKIAVEVFHFFFAHFQIVMLEFSYALKLKRYRLSGTFLFDERWDDFASGIERFLEICELTNYLLPDHTFFFFPHLNSMNSKERDFVFNGSERQRPLIGWRVYGRRGVHSGLDRHPDGHGTRSSGHR